jgi:hypothetical protein
MTWNYTRVGRVLLVSLNMLVVELKLKDLNVFTFTLLLEFAGGLDGLREF